MNKLAKFDQTLIELEQELGTLKNTSESYRKLEGLVQSYGKIGSHVEENSKTVIELASKFEAEHKEIKSTLNQITPTFEKNFEKLRKENREVYLDFEKTLKIKLDENKSEIKKLIEDERQKIREILVNELDKRTASILTQQKSIKKIVLIFGIITILFLIAVIIIQLKF